MCVSKCDSPHNPPRVVYVEDACNVLVCGTCQTCNGVFPPFRYIKCFFFCRSKYSEFQANVLLDSSTRIHSNYWAYTLLDKQNIFKSISEHNAYYADTPADNQRFEKSIKRLAIFSLHFETEKDIVF